MKHLIVLFAFCGLVTIAGCGGSEPTVVEGTAGVDTTQQQQYEQEMQNSYSGSAPGSSGPPN